MTKKKFKKSFYYIFTSIIKKNENIKLFYKSVIFSLSKNIFSVPCDIKLRSRNEKRKKKLVILL